MTYTKLNGLHALIGVVVVIGAMSQPAVAERYGQAFWEHWGDGRAEISAYQMTYPRYGQPRQGVAVTIIVTETFDQQAHVKSDRGNGSGPNELPVIKLNWVQDFPTGVYDYNMMTSAFVGLKPFLGYPAGAATKISFSSQEWCGHVYHQLIAEADRIQHEMHSYFQGEADRTWFLPTEHNGVAEDVLLLWAHGLAGPEVPPGRSVTVPLLRSLQHARLNHTQVVWDKVVLSRSGSIEKLSAPSGEHDVREVTAEVQRAGRGGKAAWTFWVEDRVPNRVIRWTTSDGQAADLLGSDRMAYWQMNREGQQAALAKLGLQARPPATP